MSEVRLVDIDAVELGELLETLARFFTGAPAAVQDAFAAFIGAEGYALSDLARDCQRFAFLLGVAEHFALEEEPS